MQSQYSDTLMIELSNSIQDLIEHSASDITFWFNVNLAIQIAIIMIGLIATMVTAVQTDKNSRLTKPIAVLSAVLLTTVNSTINIFHTHENLRIVANTFVEAKSLKAEYEASRLDLPPGQTASSLLKESNRKYMQIYEQFLTSFTYFGAPDKTIDKQPDIKRAN